MSQGHHGLAESGFNHVSQASLLRFQQDLQR